MLGKILPAVAFGGGIALLWPELSIRAGTLQLVTADVASLHNVSTFKEAKVKHNDILKNCEDVVIVEEEGVAILSCDNQRDGWNTVMGTFIDPAPPGALFQWMYTDPDSFPQPLSLEGFGERAVQDFHPLGIDYHAESSTLFVVNHASTGPFVELFDYTPWTGFGRPVATHRRTVSHPSLHTPNSVHALSATSFLATNDHFVRARDHALAHTLETYAGLPGGNVVHVTVPEGPAADAATTEEEAPVIEDEAPITVTTLISALPFANGLARLNATTLAVASTTTRSVRLYTLNATSPATPTLTFAREIRAPALVDNLSVDTAGRLLAAGHPRPGALTASVARRSNCIRLSERVLAAAAAAAVPEEVEEEIGTMGDDQQVLDDEDMTVKTPPATGAGAKAQLQLTDAERAELVECEERYHESAPSWVAELVLDEATGEAGWRELYVGNEGGFGSSTTAARDVKEGIVLVVGLYERGVLLARE